MCCVSLRGGKETHEQNFQDPQDGPGTIPGHVFLFDAFSCLYFSFPALISLMPLGVDIQHLHNNRAIGLLRNVFDCGDGQVFGPLSAILLPLACELEV